MNFKYNLLYNKNTDEYPGGEASKNVKAWVSKKLMIEHTIDTRIVFFSFDDYPKLVSIPETYPQTFQPALTQ
jgi:hypothetical protein